MTSREGQIRLKLQQIEQSLAAMQRTGLTEANLSQLNRQALELQQLARGVQ